MRSKYERDEIELSQEVFRRSIDSETLAWILRSKICSGLLQSKTVFQWHRTEERTDQVQIRPWWRELNSISDDQIATARVSGVSRTATHWTATTSEHRQIRRRGKEDTSFGEHQGRAWCLQFEISRVGHVYSLDRINDSVEVVLRKKWRSSWEQRNSPYRKWRRRENTPMIMRRQCWTTSYLLWSQSHRYVSCSRVCEDLSRYVCSRALSEHQKKFDINVTVHSSHHYGVKQISSPWKRCARKWNFKDGSIGFKMKRIYSPLNRVTSKDPVFILSDSKQAYVRIKSIRERYLVKNPTSNRLNSSVYR